MILLERLDERWEKMDGAAARKIDRILKERRDAATEIMRLREAAEEALNFLTSPANVTQQQRIANAIVELSDALKK